MGTAHKNMSSSETVRRRFTRKSGVLINNYCLGYAALLNVCLSNHLLVYFCKPDLRGVRVSTKVSQQSA